MTMAPQLQVPLDLENPSASHQIQTEGGISAYCNSNKNADNGPRLDQNGSNNPPHHRLLHHANSAPPIIMERRIGEIDPRIVQGTLTNSNSSTTTTFADNNIEVTVFARHKIQRGKEASFHQWIQEINQLQLEKFSGYGGFQVVKPTICCNDNGSNNGSNHHTEYVSIFRYTNYDLLQVFMNSEDRRQMLEKTCAFEAAPIELTYHSLEYWFMDEQRNTATNDGVDPALARSQPSSSRRAPPKPKMVIVTFLLIWFQSHFLGPWTRSIPKLPPLAAEALTIFTIVLGTTYVWMPIVTQHILHWWLFPKPKSTKNNVNEVDDK